jgi:hypothetical protein
VKTRVLRKHRIAKLVWVGFSFLLLLGFLTSLFLIFQLRRTVHEQEAIEAVSTTVRDSVRALRAEYIDQQLARVLSKTESSGEIDEENARKHASDERANRLLEFALRSTQSKELRRVLSELQEHNGQVTAVLEEEVLKLARTDLAAARELYSTRYLPAQDKNLELVSAVMNVRRCV